jgi:hypothetical protein
MIQRALGVLLLAAAFSIPAGVGAAVTTVSVPEPGTLVLLATGIAGLGAAAWRRRD